MARVLQAKHHKRYVASRIWNRMRVQMGGVLLIGIVVPMAILSLFYPNFLLMLSAQQTALGAALAALASVYLVRNISLYPGIHSAFFVFPSVLTCFGLTFLAFLLFRLDYSRATMLGAGGATLIWLYVVQLMIERAPPVRVGIVPFGNVAKLTGIASLEFTWLHEPARGDEQYDFLVADFRADLPDEWEAFLSDCALEGTPVLHVKQLQESLTGQVEIEHLSENSFGSLIPFMGYLRLRRAIDFLSALFFGVLLMPFFLIVAVLIKLDSPGPVLFRQIRIGYRGQPFWVAKFRTMVMRQVDDIRGDAMTQDNDPRVTRLGRFLRRTRIDELPQILNILRGEMSWIGPRPEAEPLSKWYESELPFYRYRHIVPPGITGWAQVNQGHVVELNQVMNKLHYDFYYIKNFSPWLDAWIVVKTAHTIVTGFGSR